MHIRIHFFSLTAKNSIPDMRMFVHCRLICLSPVTYLHTHDSSMRQHHLCVDMHFTSCWWWDCIQFLTLLYGSQWVKRMVENAFAFTVFYCNEKNKQTIQTAQSFIQIPSPVINYTHLGIIRFLVVKFLHSAEGLCCLCWVLTSFRLKWR